MDTFSMPPDCYREIDICPDASELVNEHVPFLRKNIVFGKYDEVEHYLDVQFRLLREDFVRPLRESITEYTRSKNEAKAVKMDKKITVHQSVRIRRQAAVYTCKFDAGPSKNIDWKVSVY